MNTALIGMVFQKNRRSCYTGESVGYNFLVTEVTAGGVVATRVEIGDDFEYRLDEIEMSFAIVRPAELEEYKRFFPEREMLPIEGSDLHLLTPESRTDYFDSWLQHQVDFWQLLRDLGWKA